MISIPYTVYARIIPDRGNGERRVYTNSMEKIVNIISDDLEESDFDVPDYHVSSVPQFAQYPSKVVITGFDYIDEVNFQPATKVAVDHSGEIKEGYIGTRILHKDQSLDPRVRTYMLALKSALESASTYLDDIIRIDYMGITFGEGGYSFQ